MRMIIILLQKLYFVTVKISIALHAPNLIQQLIPFSKSQVTVNPPFALQTRGGLGGGSSARLPAYGM